MKYERFEQILKKKYYKELMKFMEGQTVNENEIYEDDFLRWFHKLEVID